jgi:hypothetical protein
MSHRLLVFLGNKLANVGSGDVEVLRLLAGVCCTLGVDYTPADLTRVVCVGIVSQLQKELCTDLYMVF